MKVLVTGANGNLGSKIVEYLLTRLSIEEIIVGVRDDKSEKALSYKEQGLEVRVTDFENQETLFSAFKDVDRLFIMSTFGDFDTVIRQHTNAVEAAKATGVKQIIYPSVTRAESYELSGENLKQQQFVDTLSEVLGKEIPLLEVDDSSYEEMLKGAGVPEAYLPMLVMTQKGIREGGLESTHTHLNFLLEHQATRLKQALTHLLVNTK
ncbi:NmrA family NAD(P)-binding protein [Bacillus sp. SIMBA_074]|uniref:NmrA family NAD(P)-binding protein n=1 Tax=Bacillus sp. SIMBA_074 TaxID=3085812 RepID=UPI00397E6BE0